MSSVALISVFSVLAAAGALCAGALRLRGANRRASREAARAAALARCLALLSDAMQAPARGLMATPDSEHARRLLDLADQATDLLAAHAGPRILREEDLALGALVQEVVAALDAPGRRWRFDPGLEAVTLRGDNRALRAALRAVLQRALRETAADDRIALRLMPAPDVVALVVEDEGAGQAAADLDPGGEATGTRGLVLGLATARDLLRAHGGDLMLEAASGIGARAWLTLPNWRLVAAAA
ncbi:sensor histidine kinase [Humitalea sp. 24SJ18S-53]|uniref:sensor histidine kinase n=1 Tax=Humitalea sp. 24SJ18S-53 TaxID=3422307 RepID=UPI003D66BDBC